MSYCLSVYAFSPRLLLDGVYKPFSDDAPLMQPVLRSDVVMVPVSMFDHLPDTRTLPGTEGVVIRHQNQNYDFTALACTERGYLCLPAVACANAMGISARAFDHLVVFADQARLDALAVDETTLSKLRQQTCGIYNAGYFTAEDFKKGRDCWRYSLCGNRFSNDPSVPGMNNLLRMRDEDSENLRRQMNRGENIPILFGTQPPVASAELELQYDRILRIAQAFGTVGCRSYRAPEVLKDILYALDWMHDHMYGTNVLSDSSFRSYKAFNWWEWFVGGACPMMDTVMIIEEFLSREQVAKYLLPISFIRTQMRVELLASMAMSRIVSFTPLALLLEDRALLQAVYVDVVRLLEEHDSGDNMRRDWCCMSHGMPYNICYGVCNLNRVAMVLRVLKDSPLAFPIPNSYNLMQMARYTFATSLYHGQGLSMMNGRYMQSDAGATAALSILKSIHYLFGLFGEQEDRELYELIHRNATPAVREGLISTYDSGISYEQYLKINTTSDHTQVPKTPVHSYAQLYQAITDPQYATGPVTLGYMWYSGDSCVQFRKDHLFALRMSSKRSMAYESINGANGDGWYTGDGMLYLYTPNDPLQYGKDWWRGVDKHLMPGTTVEDRQRVKECYDRGYRSRQDFVGGVSLDGQFLCTSMDLESFHNEVDEGRNSGYGRSLPVYLCTLTAQKSYFFFDKVAVALGTNVQAHDGYAVRTVVEHRMLPNGLKGVLVNGEPLAGNGFTREDVYSIFLPDAGAYFFPLGGTLTLRVYENEGMTFITFYFEHGVDPENGGYCYVVLLEATQEESAAYDISDIEILRAAGGIHAVRERSSGLMGVVFRKAGSLDRYTAHQPMILLSREEGDDLRLSACDPTQLLDSFDYTVGDAPVHVVCDSSRGRGYTASFKRCKGTYARND